MVRGMQGLLSKGGPVEKSVDAGDLLGIYPWILMSLGMPRNLKSMESKRGLPRWQIGVMGPCIIYYPASATREDII